MRYCILTIMSVVIFSLTQTCAQNLLVDGNVSDKQDGISLSYATIRVLGTMRGATTNNEGKFRINLQAGKYTLVASYLGYNSDTVKVDLTKGNASIDFRLIKIAIPVPNVIITPGINPALAIIKEVINKKEKRAMNLKSYEMDFYTKGIFKSNQEKTNKNDTAKNAPEIVGILENTGTSYYKTPDLYKDIISARKQTANFPSEINTLTGNRIVQCFYEDKIHFFDISIPGPVADNALSYYDYYIEDSLFVDNNKIYKIQIQTINSSAPGFTGSIFIIDKTFDLLKVDVALNRPANVGGLLDTVRIFQQFQPFESLYMPADYRIFVKLNLFELIKLSVELNSVMTNYKINSPINDELFGKAIVTVLPDADEKDSTYWHDSQSIPNTAEEKKAYSTIDSIAASPKTIKELLLNSLAEGYFPFNKNFAVTSPLNMYHFNRVEGHAIDFGVMAKELFDKRLTSQVKLHYGFSDKKYKSEFEVSLLLGNYRTYNISFNAFRSIYPLFNESNDFNDFTSTIFALAFDNDYLNYYYSKGFKAKFGGDILPILNADFSFINRTDNSAIKNTDFTFSENKTKLRNDNQPIFETKVNAVDFNLNIDFRDFIEDGFNRIRESNGNSYTTLSAGIMYSSERLINSGINFTIYKAKIEGLLNSFWLTNLDYKLFASYSDDAVPYQMLYALPGNIDGANSNTAFRTAKLGMYFGNRILTLNLNYNFFDDFFRLFPVPGIKNWNLQINSFFNAGWIDISDKSKEILPTPTELLVKPLMEAGFGIGYSLLPIKLEFAWRLTHTNENAFSIGINSAIFLK